MSRRTGFGIELSRFLGGAVAVVLLFPSILFSAPPSPASASIAALDQAIMIRTGTDGKTYGENEVDPLLWRGSRYFLAGVSRAHLIAALTDVMKFSDDDVRRCPPAQRALAQNRVWTVFDHVQRHTAARTAVDRDFLRALAGVMAKLALAPSEISAIADPLVTAVGSARWPDQPSEAGGSEIFLPTEIARETAPWRTLGLDRSGVTAENHTTHFGGRSLFIVRAHFPDGGPAPENYFKAVADFPHPWLKEKKNNPTLNPAVPQLPVRAEFALIRRLAVVDRTGHWQATPLTLSLQVRQYRVTAREEFEKRLSLGVDSGESNPFALLQSFAEFELATTPVSAGEAAELKPLLPGDRRFMFLFAHETDLVDGAGEDRFPGFQPGPNVVPMERCANCHSGLGLRSVNVLMMQPRAFGPKIGRLVPRTIADEAVRTAQWKIQQSEWIALQTFWPGAEMPVSTH